MTGIEDVIRRLENQKAAIERALTSLREVDGSAAPTTTPAADGVAAPSAPARHKRRRKKLTEGTMKARTVELLRTAAKPMRSGEVAKRMKIESGYASVNLSQLRRDGFLRHTPEGYAVI